MNETEWAKSVQEFMSAYFRKSRPTLSCQQGRRLTYASEIMLYKDKSPLYKETPYETDLLVAREKATPRERKDLLEVLRDEIKASRSLEEMLYNARKSDKKRYVVLHKPLKLR